ncbi:ferrochelatase [Lacticaseibacillus paracasei]|uniref:ferrochelatase n=1 Tax=Lacticaseibacillus paracasei TaxID=1597 RepID=UPI0031D7BD02
MEKIAVLLMAYGTPYKIEDIWDYYTRIRQGHKPPQKLYDQLAARYKAIGGTSPLAKITKDQADGLQAQLDQKFPGKFEVFIGLKYISPLIAKTIDQIVEAGFKKIIGLPLAPYGSEFATTSYHRVALRELSNYPGISYYQINSWWNQPAFIEFWSEQLKRLVPLTTDTEVIFSAHSLPLKVIKNGDTYEKEVRGCIKAIVEAAGLTSAQYTIAWQSAGRTPDPWLEPDLMTTAQSLIKHNNINQIISCSVGFIADNLEILYDIDLELKKAVAIAGGKLKRLQLPNADPLLIISLVKSVLNAIQQGNWECQEVCVNENPFPRQN